MTSSLTGGHDVSVIVVSYNTQALTVSCLRALGRCRGEVDFDVVVVDNASADGTAEAVAREFSDVRMMRLPENVGFGRAVNRAASLVDTEYLLLLNPDTEPMGPLVDDLVRFARQNPGHGLYTGRTLRADGSDDGYSCWGLPTLWSMFCFATGLSAALPHKAWANPEGLPTYDRRGIQEVPAVSGCVLLIDRKLFVEVGGFDPQFFLYSEDIDLSKRVAALGARPIVYPKVAVIHAVGASSGSTNQRVMLLRGKATYLRRHWSPLKARLGLGLLRAGVALRAAEARLRPQHASADWREVWRQRRTWIAGWPPVDEPRPRPDVRVTFDTHDHSK